MLAYMGVEMASYAGLIPTRDRALQLLTTVALADIVAQRRFLLGRAVFTSID